MKYNIYLIIGITFLTMLILFIFSGIMSETETGAFESDMLDISPDGHTALLLGIGLPLVLIVVYFAYARTKKSEIHHK